MSESLAEKPKTPSMGELLQRERALQRELNSLRMRLARMVSSTTPDSQLLRPLEKDHSLTTEEDNEEYESVSRFVVTAPIEKDSPLPSILLRPLSLKDPLRSKWNLGLGLPHPQEKRGRKRSGAEIPAIITPDISEAIPGYVRIYGLLPSGAPCQCKLPLNTIATEGQMVIGRDPTIAQIVIPEIGVSRAHAILEYINDQLVISDNESTNGLFINNHRLSSYEKRAPLYDGCIVNFGETTLRVEIVQ